MKNLVPALLASLVVLQFTQPRASAWDYECHRVINELALSCLPDNFPKFVNQPAARERIAFLSGEPDRWRNVTDLPLRHFNNPDHYIDLDELEACGLSPETLPMFRYDFVAAVALARAAHPERFAPIDPTKNEDHTRQLVGFLPWAIVELHGKLKSGFSYLRALEEGGTPEEIANARQNIIYIMGVMGHFVGDAAQPLHTTKHFNGWVGENPRCYTTNRYIHAWIDGGYFVKVGGVKAKDLYGKMRPARVIGDSARPDEPFRQVVQFVVESHGQVQPLYELEKARKFSGEGEEGLQGRPFLEGQLVRAAQMLADLWYTAWLNAPEDTYLKRQLQKRDPTKAGAGAGAKPATR